MKHQFEWIINKQFEIAGHDVRYPDIATNTPIKKKSWWEVYKFENQAQYEKWLGIARKELENRKVANVDKTLAELDLQWGMMYK